MPADTAALVDLVRHVLADLGVNPLAEVSLLLVDADHMAELHEKWMDEPGPTDVLAFPMDELELARGPGSDAAEGPALLGDVVLCPPVAQRQAAVAGHSTQAELELLCTHGLLHLLGYDHAEEPQEREMFAAQQRLLDTFRDRRPRPGAGRHLRP